MLVFGYRSAVRDATLQPLTPVLPQAHALPIRSVKKNWLLRLPREVRFVQSAVKLFSSSGLFLGISRSSLRMPSVSHVVIITISKKSAIANVRNTWMSSSNASLRL